MLTCCMCTTDVGKQGLSTVRRIQVDAVLYEGTSGSTSVCNQGLSTVRRIQVGVKLYFR